MIVDLTQLIGDEPFLTQPADVCIVGAGAAGIALTVELARQGMRVLLLEGGGSALEGSSQDLYRSEVTGHRHDGIHIGRFRRLGGSTTEWGGQILELDESDFTHRPWIPGSGWPFPKETLTGSYARALRLEGLEGSIRSDGAIWNCLRHEDPLLSDELDLYFSRWCPEPNFARLHGHTLRSHPNVTVCLHANACRLVLDDGNQEVAGILCRTLPADGSREVIVHANAYVLCIGGIETCRFLLQPTQEGIAPWSRSNLLGKHYIDHIDRNCAEFKDIDPKKFNAYFDNVYLAGFKYQPRFKFTSAAAEKYGTLAVDGTMIFTGEAGEHLQRLRLAAQRLMGREMSAADLRLLSTNLPTLVQQTYRYKIQKRAFNPADASIQLLVHVEQEPMSESTISLSDERDPLGLFRARIEWRISDLELKTMQTFVQRVQSAFHRSGLAQVVPDSALMDGDPSYLDKVGDSYHHMGGTRMSTSPADGVVDPNLKLFGVRNAYICSSSVFPSGGFSNPTHTLIALAVRLADHLACEVHN